jgi:chromosome segregation ATPase
MNFKTVMINLFSRMSNWRTKYRYGVSILKNLTSTKVLEEKLESLHKFSQQRPALLKEVDRLTMSVDSYQQQNLELHRQVAMLNDKDNNILESLQQTSSLREKTISELNAKVNDLWSSIKQQQSEIESKSEREKLLEDKLRALEKDVESLNQRFNSMQQNETSLKNNVEHEKRLREVMSDSIVFHICRLIVIFTEN